MRRHRCDPRPNWQSRVEEKGLVFHTTEDGAAYWNESAFYELSAREVDLLSPALALLFAELPPVPWHPTNFGESVLATVVFGGIGIIMAILGFKIFDWLTPGNLQQEIFEKNNTAAAILGGAFILGVCWIIAAVVS